MSGKEKIFAFDMGVASLGICVRQGEEVKRLDSLIIPAEYASTKDAANRRRMIRTRLAHHKREGWWKKCCSECGIEVLETLQPIYDSSGKLLRHVPDPRMLREFSAAGDDTVYNSSLLRISLLQGRTLESWQVFKAVWSAIQHRGFLSAAELPWAKTAKRNLSEEEAGAEEEGAKDLEDETRNAVAADVYLKRLATYSEDCRFPCYYEAERMGLWDPQHPRDIKLRHEFPSPEAARNKDGVKVVASRRLIEAEVKLLLTQAAKQFPKLKGRENYIMYGEAGVAFPSVVKPQEWRHIRGGEKEAEGILSQKTPRFDNRAVNKCCLIPRLNVCAAKDELNKEVFFLLALKNIRYSFGDKPDCALDPAQLKEIYLGFVENSWPQAFPLTENKKTLDSAQAAWCSLLFQKGVWKKQFHLTATQWRKWLENRIACEVNPAHPKIPAPKIGGRSSYCRPALRLVKELLLSGQAPSDFYKSKVGEVNNEDSRKGLVRSEYDFLKNMGNSWYAIHIPDNRLADAELITTPSVRQRRIEEIINDVRNPVVRHRLHYLVSRLQSMKDAHGEPDKVYYEFVREDFMGEKAKREYEKRIRDNQKARDIAFKEAEQLGLKGDGILKMRLYREQCGVDYYEAGENEKIAETEIASCEIDHIVPRSMRGPDAFYNLILTRYANNQAKKERTPFQWLGNTPAWDKLAEKIGRNSCDLSSRKQRLLLSAKPEELVEKYTALAETAYIAKLAQKITALYFGWPEGVRGTHKRIFVSNGAQTARVRRRYKLDRLLHADISSDEEFAKLVREGKLDKKNRGNHRHHALDALVISMEADLENNKETGDFSLPAWFHAGFAQKHLDTVVPTNVKFQKPLIAQTIYGLRKAAVGEDGYVAISTAKTSATKPTRLEDWAKLKLADAKKRVHDIYSEQMDCALFGRQSEPVFV
ncbi:MAG TPA: HNH endonuclease domain-containing protein [Elusimicrobiales bacterium]|nr:HNH endonuclease domain-containing protein [Elusimicrobiales bacterium]